MYKYVHCSIFYDSKKAESNLIISFLGDWLDYIMVCPYSWILYNH